MDPKIKSPRGYTSEQRGLPWMWHREGGCSGSRVLSLMRPLDDEAPGDRSPGASSSRRRVRVLGPKARKVATRLHDLAQLHVQALDRVGGVEETPNLDVIREDRQHMGPVSAPERGDRRILEAPRALGEGVERRDGRRLGRGLVDRTRPCS